VEPIAIRPEIRPVTAQPIIAETRLVTPEVITPGTGVIEARAITPDIATPATPVIRAITPDIGRVVTPRVVTPGKAPAKKAKSTTAAKKPAPGKKK
jgi:hypothetical protein